MKFSIFGFSLLALMVASCRSNSNTTATQKENTSESQTAPEKKLVVELEEKNHSGVKATATFTEKDGVVYLHFQGSGFTPGLHAIHLHEKADCSADNGTSAGGHWNPTFKKHGKWGEGDFHRGDIGNFTADENGNATLDFQTNLWCIDCDDETKNIVNKAIIIHQGEDDFVSQPSGDAGSRVSCGAIIR